MCEHRTYMVFVDVYWCSSCGALYECAKHVWDYPSNAKKPHECEDFVWNSTANTWRCIECKKPYVRGYGEHEQPELQTDDGG